MFLASLKTLTDLNIRQRIFNTILPCFTYQQPPTFKNIPTHNPGGWPLFSFAPQFDKKKNYIGHFTPLGAQVVPTVNGDDTTRSFNERKFHYRGWKQDAFDVGMFVRDSATADNLKPVSRHGSVLLSDAFSADVTI
jgi:hypothetical protein